MNKIFRYVLYSAGVVLVLVAAVASYLAVDAWRHDMLFHTPVYDTQPLALPPLPNSPRVLVFSKTNGYRHLEAIPAANAMFAEFSEQEKWSVFFTENAASHTSGNLAQFDLVIWNCVSGDVLSDEQRAAFRGYVEGGGVVLAVHASGGDPAYAWPWHPEEFIRAQFIGHPLVPQFQEAIVKVEDREHPATRHLPAEWAFRDELYSFRASPRDRVNVLASLDESTYSPTLVGPFGSLRMGDHPIIWHHKVGEGTVFYSALGHLAETYADANYRTLLLEACRWLLALKSPPPPGP